MTKITEIIPDDLPDWAIKAMAEGQFFNVVSKKIKKLDRLEKKIADHNIECIRSCNDKRNCGYERHTDASSDCGNCTKDWMIDI